MFHRLAQALLLLALCACANVPETAPGSAKDAATVRFAAGTSAKIPVRMEKNLIFAPIRVNGSRTMYFLLDTGAGGTILRGAEADALGLASEGVADVTGGAGTTSVRRLAPVEFGLPGVDLANVTLAAGLDDLLDGLSGHVGMKVDGIIGFNVIAPFMLEIDGPGKSVTLHSASTDMTSMGGDVAPLVFINNKPAVNLTLTTQHGRSVQGVFVLDTGSDGDISVNTPFVRQHQLLGEGGVGTSYTGVGGNSDVVSVEMLSAQIGSTAIERPTAGLSRGNSGNDGTLTYDGTVGQRALGRFRVIYDYPKSQIVIAPSLPR
jgi:hypothetical protein